MYLSDRDIHWSIQKGHLICNPDAKIDPTSVDLRLDSVKHARIWDVKKLLEERRVDGIHEAEVRLGQFRYVPWSAKYLTVPPDYNAAARDDDPVCVRGNELLVRPGGFVLWQTKDVIGTPQDNPQLICFVDGKSTRARAGIMVHLTAPTIHAGWSGNVVLEIANVGPLTFVLQEDDVIAQLTVARISSVPEQTHAQAGSSTFGQTDVSGKA